MKKLVLAALAGATAMGGAAIATQTPPQQPAVQEQRPAPPATRDEALARADRMFQRIDADGDGQVTATERETMQQRQADRREARGKMPGKRGGRMGEQMLARVDANGDGNISREEFREQALARFQRIDANGDGRVDAAEQQAMAQKRADRRERMEARRAARTAQPQPPAE